jgi:signal transduction histidine kinase
MLPKSVLHKQNGHRHLPPPGTPSAAQLLGLVHRDPARASDLSPDLVRFAAIIQSEQPANRWEQIADEGLSLPSALAKALTRTREAFEQGELSDVRLALEALKAQAEAAVRFIARLTEASRAKDSEPARDAERSLVNLNDLTIHTLALLAGAPSVASRLDPRLPRVAADPRQMQNVLMILITAVARSRDGAERPGTIMVETTHRDGVLNGERVVRLLVTDDYPRVREQLRPVPVLSFQRAETSDAGTEVELRRAARLVKEHGGVLCAAILAGGGVCFTLDVPAV